MTTPIKPTELEKALERLDSEVIIHDIPDQLGMDLQTVLNAAKRLKEVEKENETLHEQLDKGFQILFECGYCECGGKIVHHIDEPLFDCDTCNRHGESTTIPLIQRFTIQTQKNEQDLSTLRAEYKNALEDIQFARNNLSSILDDELKGNPPLGYWSALNKLNARLSTPLAIATRKGEKE